MVKKIVIGVVVLVAVAIGGVFFYAKVIEGDAPTKLSLSDEPATSSRSSDSSSKPVALDGTWKASKESTVGYRVTEDFVGGLTNAEAVGRTHDVNGSLTIAGTTVTGSNFVVDMSTVRSDRSQRDGQSRVGSWMSLGSRPRRSS
jgi:hypothetical protein